MPDKPVVVTEKRDPNDPDVKATVHAAGEPPRHVKIAERSVVVSLGSTRRKRIKQLKRGTGKLVGEVRTAVEIAAGSLGQDLEGKTLVPVVLVYRERSSSKKRRRGGELGICPLCCV